MGHASKKFFSHTHYGISTVAAVLYAIAWMLGNQVRADSNSQVVLPAVTVTAQRIVRSVATLDPVIVTASREVGVERYAMLDPVFVLASREVAVVDVHAEPTVFGATRASTDSPRAKGIFSTVRSWLVAALLK